MNVQFAQNYSLIIEKQELDEYTSLALHSYRQVINWLKKKATNEIQIRAGI